MATIKLGNTTLVGFSFGGNTTIVTPKRISTTIRAPKVTQAVALSLKGNNTPSEPNYPISGGGGDLTNWLLANGVWSDNGVWDDTQTWND